MGRAENLRGVTLLELLTAMTILAIVGLFSAPILYSAYRSFETSNAQLRLQNHLHLAMREIVDYIEGSVPLPISGSIGDKSVNIISLTKIELYNFVNPRKPNPPLPSDFEYTATNYPNYAKTTIEYNNGVITRTTSRPGAFSTIDIVRTLGLPEQAKADLPEPVHFTNNMKFEYARDSLNSLLQNAVSITLEGEAKTKYGTFERATLTVIATARGRRAGD